MENLMFRTDDGFVYDEGKHFVMINHSKGGYRKDLLGNTGEYMFSNLEDDCEEEQQLFGRIREILRVTGNFKEKVEV